MTSESKLLTEYINFLRDYRALSEDTIALHQRFVKSFLHSLGEIARASKLFKLSVKAIHDYIITTTKPLSRGSKKQVISSIRSFLKFSHIKGYLKRDLLEAVPTIPTRRLERLPKGVAWKDARKLLTQPDRKTAIGRRDFAILALLINYGVRIGQITKLKLQNIHWQAGTIYFEASKGGNALCFPLHAEVANALLAYIHKDRGIGKFQEVFLTVNRHQRPLGKNNDYHAYLKRYYIKAGINFPHQGSRPIRHTFATRLINQNIPIKAIADLLGHRQIETTFIYTKVNLNQLRKLNRCWPEVM